MAHVFPKPDGEPVRDLYGSWRAACREAGAPGPIIHDLRRGAVRALERAGVSRSVGIRLVGHRTESIYRRYALVSESDLHDGAARLAAAQSKREGDRTA